MKRKPSHFCVSAYILHPDKNNYKYLAAGIKGRYIIFEDGNLVTIELLENLQVYESFNRKSNLLKGKGRFMGNRIYMNPDYGVRNVLQLDSNGKKGIFTTAPKNKALILLKIINSSN